MPGPDVFDQLLAAKFRDIEFPVTRMRVSIAHDLVEHKYWGVDGARVESTGLAPIRYSFSAPLLNGISPGRNEKWAALYPNQMRILLAAFQKKEKGNLQHPEFGNIPCKAERFDLDWDAARRGGVDAELSFVQTLTDESVEFADTPVREVDIGELDSPTREADLEKLLRAKGLEPPPANKTSFGDLLNAVNKVVTYPQLLSYKSAGQVNALLYQARRAQESAELSRSALTWPITQDVERLKASAFAIRDKLLQGPKVVAFFTVPAATTLAGVCRQIPTAKITDLIKLNPGLMRGPEIDKGTVVRYYRAA